MTAFCVKCKKKVQPQGVSRVIIKRRKGRGSQSAISGTCPKCRTKVFRFVKAGFGP